jgi:hypothetical protein
MCRGLVACHHGGVKWFSVRSVYRHPGLAEGREVYEERVVLFKADDFDAAIAMAESEAADYVEDSDNEVLPLFQAHWLFDDPADGIEIFSLMRVSDLEPDEYLDHFFDTGQERQQYAE